MKDFESSSLMNEISSNAKTLKDVVMNINSKIKEEEKITKSLNEQVKITQNKMDFVTGKLSILLKTKDNSQLYTIILLFIVLMIQIFLLMFL